MKRAILTILSIFLLCGGISAGSLYARQERIEANREKGLKDVLRNDPGDYTAMTQLGALYWERRKKFAAIIQFRKALKVNPDYPIPYYFLGEAYFLERKPEKSIANYKLFIEKMDAAADIDGELTEFYISALYRIGGRFGAMKEYEYSLRAFNRIIALDPDDPKAHYNLAVLYYNYFHNRIKAFSELNKVIAMDPESQSAAKAEFFIDYMRRNPDSRITGDFSFMDKY
jgi:tetratricopeptide (TPR) repeat protein